MWRMPLNWVFVSLLLGFCLWKTILLNIKSFYLFRPCLLCCLIRDLIIYFSIPEGWLLVLLKIFFGFLTLLFPRIPSPHDSFGPHGNPVKRARSSHSTNRMSTWVERGQGTDERTQSCHSCEGTRVFLWDLRFPPGRELSARQPLWLLTLTLRRSEGRCVCSKCPALGLGWPGGCHLGIFRKSCHHTWESV